VHDSDYWLRITQQALRWPDTLRIESRIVQLVTEIAPLSRNYRSFAGWFMNEEIDDINCTSRGHLRFALLPAASE